MAGLDIRGVLAEHEGQDYDLYAQTINPQFVKMLRTIGYDRLWSRAEGAYIFDSDGRRFLDMNGGFGMFNAGRNNPRIRQALQDVLDLDTPGSVQLGVSLLPGLLGRELLERMPERIEHCLFTNSGTEAVEAALKLGRAAAGRSRVLSASKGFHGLTLGSLSANGGAEWSERFGPLLPEFDQVPWNDLGALEDELKQENVALFVVEPLQGKGVNLPAPGYLEGAQELCRRYGTYFVLDEVQTGFGRTGKMFALEHWGLEPDIVTVSKSLSGGYIPVGACLVSKEVYESVFDSLEHAVSHGSTFAPNDLAMAAGLATLYELDEQGLVERSAKLGNLLLERTEPFVERYDVVREVRGLGLMWAIEFQEPEGGSRTWRMLERRQPGIFSQLVAVPLFSEHAILIQTAGHHMNVLKGIPSLTVTEADIEYFASALEQTLQRAQKIPAAMMRFALKAARAGRKHTPALVR
jgi:ornithine--oxo-acid transaminase